MLYVRDDVCAVSLRESAGVGQAGDVGNCGGVDAGHQTLRRADTADGADVAADGSGVAAGRGEGRQKEDCASTGGRVCVEFADRGVGAVGVLRISFFGEAGWGCRSIRRTADYLKQLKGMEPAIFTALARWHVLPESYLYGMIDVRGMSIGFPTYIFGQVHAHGVWYYFPVAFVIKSTAAFLILLAITVFAIAAGKLRARREILFMAVPVAIYFIIAMGTGLNIGARHVLPMYAFLCVLIGAAAVALCRANPTWVYAVGLLLAWHMVSTTRAYPDYIAYSNEFWGGPSNTYKYLTDSNTDWAQQLKAVKTYLDERGVKDCYFAYFAEPVVDFRDYGIPCKPLPTADTGWFNLQVDTPPTVTGTVLISAGSLTGFELGSNVLNPYRNFQKIEADGGD